MICFCSRHVDGAEIETLKERDVACDDQPKEIGADSVAAGIVNDQTREIGVDGVAVGILNDQVRESGPDGVAAVTLNDQVREIGLDGVGAGFVIDLSLVSGRSDEMAGNLNGYGFGYLAMDDDDHLTCRVLDHGLGLGERRCLARDVMGSDDAYHTLVRGVFSQ